MSKLLIDRIETPIGTLLIVVDGDRLCALDLHGDAARLGRLLGTRYGDARLHAADDPAGVSTRLRAYFRGDFGALDAIQVDTGGTPFQRDVWSALREIAPGTTVTYGEIARRVGRPRATRAVGITNGLNPVAIVVPCHRVIGADASLTGYGGGLHRKQWLLQHEGLSVRSGMRQALPAQLSLYEDGAVTVS